MPSLSNQCESLLVYYKARYEKGKLLYNNKFKYFNTFQEVELRYRILYFFCDFCVSLDEHSYCDDRIDTSIYQNIFSYFDKMLINEKMKRAIQERKLPNQCKKSLDEIIMDRCIFQIKIEDQNVSNQELFSYFIQLAARTIIVYIDIREAVVIVVNNKNSA